MATKAKRILIADDDRKLLDMLALHLKNAGYEVILAQDSYRALESARRLSPDLMVLDVNMPAGDGFSVQERLNKISDVNKMPVIYLTGERSPRVALGSAGFHASVIYKPFEVDQLLEGVRAALGETAGGGPLGEAA